MPEANATKKLPKKAPLLEQIKEADLANVFIGLGAGVDPDGLASQMAMSAIVKHINPAANVDCFYRGTFDRAQNRTMKEVLNLSPKPYSEFEEGKYSCLTMVDGNASVMPLAKTVQANVSRLEPWISPHFIIDHHVKKGEPIIGEDVRPIGSCSAIMWEYIMELNPELLEGEDGAILATALSIGICTDTVEKTVPKTSPLDWAAEGYCGARCDVKLYSAIKNYPRPVYQKDLEMEAWRNKVIEGTVLVTPLGILPIERKGAISTVAEEFCGQGPVKTTLSVGMINGDLHFSMRTFTSSINADNFIRKILEAKGGGKPGSGAGVIPMPKFCKDLPLDMQKEIFKSAFLALCQKTFEFAGDGVRIHEKGTSNEGNT